MAERRPPPSTTIPQLTLGCALLCVSVPSLVLQTWVVIFYHEVDGWSYQFATFDTLDNRITRGSYPT